jgi:sucrose-phosphate synthase
MRILFLNPQGNFDKNDSYWTMHPDFGGQLVYVKEIATAMAQKGHKVDIVTRFIQDENFPEFTGQIDHYDNIDNLRIVRIKAGPLNFLNKEDLWPYINEWTDNIISFYKNEGTTIDFMTGHYGDGGLACAILKNKLSIPYSFTGHSLGAQKMDKLGVDASNYNEFDNKYHFTKRITAERRAIENSNIIFVSTKQERDEQYRHPLYANITEKHFNPPKFVVSPPGANTKVFAPLGEDVTVNERMKLYIEKHIERDIESGRKELPFIISASRLDPKKNHLGLVKAFAKNKKLNSRSNLMISVRGIENAFESYQNASVDEKVILDEIFSVIHEYDLVGKITFISINSQRELADTYRYMTTKNSVFALTALYEPFGLAPIEAMSTGLPAVVTKYGGPSDVLQENNEQFGVLVDAFDEKDIAKGILDAFSNYEFYKKQGLKRVREKYTWNATAYTYLNSIKEVVDTFVFNENSSNMLDYKFSTENEEDLDKDIIINYLSNKSD